MSRPRRGRAAAVLARAGFAALALQAAGAAAAGSAGDPAGSLAFCDQDRARSAGEQDRLLRFAAIAREVVASPSADGSAPGEVALIARSGLDLQRFAIRYSHAGLALRDSPNGAWSVRQLYYACSEGRPRLYDQGLAGFVHGTDDSARGWIAIVRLPGAEGAAVARAALDTRGALGLLGARYSANAYPWALRYQNCNQWVIELLARAWSGEAAADAGTTSVEPQAGRAAAQRWLAAAGYAPADVDVGSHVLKFAAGFVPWVHLDDHPDDAGRYGLHQRISLPASIEAFVHARLPQAERIELCHAEGRVVIRRGWAAIEDGCRPGPGDEVRTL